MKTKFSKILGVGLTLALLASLVFSVAPVSALTQPSVSLSHAVPGKENDLSAIDVTYSIMFNLGEDLPRYDDIIIEFPDGTDISGTLTIALAGTSGIGSPSFATATTTHSVDGQELTITVTEDIGTNSKIGVGAMVQVKVDGVGNPDTPDDYTLDVSTQDYLGVEIEAAVTSAEYTIGAPDIPGLPGIISVYNPSGILMTMDTGSDAIWRAIDGAGDDYTIKVGPGTYDELPLVIDLEGLTLVSTDGATTTIIDGTTGIAISIEAGADNVIIDGFTINDASSTGIWCKADDVTIQNNVVTNEGSVKIGIDVAETATGVTVSGNEIDEYGTMFVHGSNCTISGNTFGESINIEPGSGKTLEKLSITDNIIISAASGIDFFDNHGGTGFKDILIEGNTISEAAGTAGIRIRDPADVTNLVIIGNDITDNEGDGILIDSGVTITAGNGIAIMFNNITGNDTSTGDYGIQNASDEAVDATFNWWGTTVAADIADMVSGTTLGKVDYEPYLADTAGAVFSAFDAAVGADSLDAKDEVGVKVTGATDADVIAAGAYNGNPQEAIADAQAFFDVYVAGAATGGDGVKIKFYAGGADTVVYVWSPDTDIWVKQDTDYSAYGGYVYITIDESYLTGTPFVLVDAPGALDIANIGLTAPQPGSRDVAITNTAFTWKSVEDADSYMVALSANYDLSSPIFREFPTGTAYTYTGTLDYDTPYYWQVLASGAGEPLGESDVGTFTTAVEPLVPPALTYTCPDCGLVFPTQEGLAAHWTQFHAPVAPAPEYTCPECGLVYTTQAALATHWETYHAPVAEATPAYIWVIIGVGAVLVVGVLVLIIRTRRVV